jgi:hypothetical protein
MSGAVSLGTALAVGAGVAAVSTMVQKPKTPQAPKVQAPEAPSQSQAAQAPDQVARRSQQAAAAGGFTPGGSSTMLTDAAGVDPSELLLGKNTLLGQ